MKKVKKILVTGSAGFIGMNLIKSLCEEKNSEDKYDIVGIDNFYNINREIKNERFLSLLNANYHNLSMEEMDIGHYNQIKYLFEKEKFDIVINLAALTGVRKSLEKPFEYIRNNIIGFHNIINISKEYKIEHFIYASSSSIYGMIADKSEDEPCSLYAATKKSNELIAHSYSHNFDINTTGLRFFTVYGPYGRPDMAPWIFTERINNNEEISVFNNGEMFRDFTYIDDIIIGIKKVLNNEPKTKYNIYDIGNGDTIEINNFIKIIEKILNKKATINYEEMHPGDVLVTMSNIIPLKDDFNYRPKTNIETGMKKFIDWFLKWQK